MASESLATVPRTFWNFSGKYVLDSETTPSQALNDAGCLLEAATATVMTLIDGLEDGGQLEANPGQVSRTLYGVMYQIQMANNLVCTVPHKALKEPDHGHQ